MSDVSGKAGPAPRTLVAGGVLALLLSIAAMVLAAIWFVIAIAAGAEKSGLRESSWQTMLVLLVLVFAAGVAGAVFSVAALRGSWGARALVVFGACCFALLLVSLAIAALTDDEGDGWPAGLLLLALAALLILSCALMLGRRANAWYAGEEPPPEDRPAWRRPWVRAGAVLGALVVAFGVLVGIAHWRMHDLAYGDVVWSADDLGTRMGDELVVLKGRAYVYSPGHAVVIVDLANGEARFVHEYAGGRMSLGDSGYFTITSMQELRLYAPDGDELWSRKVDLDASTLTIGEAGDVSYVVCVPQGKDDCHTAKAINVDRTGKVAWTRPLAKDVVFGRSDHITDETYLPSSPPDIDQVPSLPIEDGDGSAVQIKDGKPLGEPVHTDEHTLPVQFGSTLIGISHRGSDCRYEAVESGRPLWSTDVDCSAVADAIDNPTPRPFRDRLFVSYSGSKGDRIVSIDTRSGKADMVDIGSLYDRGVEFTCLPQAIVRQVDSTFTAYSPTTGKRLWSKTLHRDEDGYLAATDVRDGAVGWHTPISGLWPALAFAREDVDAEEQRSTDTVVITDPATGDELAHVAASYDFRVQGVAGGRVLLAVPGRLVMLK